MDDFGAFLKETLYSAGVDSVLAWGKDQGLIKSDTPKTVSGGASKTQTVVVERDSDGIPLPIFDNKTLMIAGGAFLLVLLVIVMKKR